MKLIAKILRIIGTAVGAVFVLLIFVAIVTGGNDGPARREAAVEPAQLPKKTSTQSVKKTVAPEPVEPMNKASYRQTERDVGCESRYSSDKQDDLWAEKYKNHWMVWAGTVVLPERGSTSLNVDGVGTQDLQVDFADEEFGYDLLEGQRLKVKFLMRTRGGCFLPYSGVQATVVK